MISDELIKVLDYLGAQLGITIDWSAENVLPYVKELCEKLVRYETAKAYAWIGIVCAAFIIALIFMIVYERKCGDGFGYVLFFIVLVITICACGYELFNIIKLKS